jgi:hypothetical protein
MDPYEPVRQNIKEFWEYCHSIGEPLNKFWDSFLLYKSMQESYEKVKKLEVQT